MTRNEIEAMREVMCQLFDAHPAALTEKAMMDRETDPAIAACYPAAAEAAVANGWAVRGPDGLTARNHWLGFVESAQEDMRLALLVSEIDERTEHLINAALAAIRTVLAADFYGGR